ncbi:MAG: shikimate dehydrogenase [Coriobacteriia bacterium]|nr:shikimate dehydrogenase [Coriobacteriia bacterium]MBN2839592.1 shikimate dehydrogenase [Coriobacteriia bacterium]
MIINGRTRPTAVIGWPIAQSLSPVMHNAAYEALGLNWACVPLGVPDQRALLAFTEAARSLSFVGFNVTMPYKQAMLELCDEAASLAQLAGAVNTVHCVDGRLIGYNTDGRGLLESLENDAGFDPAGRSVVILGAGGAAGAALTAFILARASDITVINRTVERAEEMLARVRNNLRNTTAAAIPLGPSAAEAVRGADLIVNATPAGMSTSDPCPLPAEWLRQGQVVLDMVYQRPETALLRAASLAGARPVSGLGMLVAQGALAIDIWMGEGGGETRAPRDVMRAAAAAALEEQHAPAGGDGS